MKLFSRDKTRDILLFERSENNNSSRVLSSEKTLFRHLIRNFIFCTSLFAHKHLTKKDYFVKGMHPDMQVALKSLPTFSTKSLTDVAKETMRLQSSSHASSHAIKVVQASPDNRSLEEIDIFIFNVIVIHR